MRGSNPSFCNEFLVSASHLPARMGRPVAGTRFDVALAARMTLELEAGRRERVAHRNIDVLAVFAVDHDLRPRQRDVEPHRELRALLLWPMQRLGDHVAAEEEAANPIQLARLFTDVTFQRAGMRNAAQDDLYGIVHRSRPLQPITAQL